MYGIVGLLLVTVVAGVARPDPDRAIDVVKADSLHREAMELFAAQDQWKRAAGLLEKAASLREDSDAKRSEELRLAAQVHWHFGAVGKAERLLVESARASSARGAVLEAAHAYLSAAEMAALDGEVQRAWSMVDAATLLAASPHLTAAQRASIEERLPARVRS